MQPKMQSNTASNSLPLSSPEISKISLPDRDPTTPLTIPPHFTSQSFEHLACIITYSTFLRDIYATNNQQVDREEVQDAWKAMITAKFAEWDSSGLSPWKKRDAIGRALAQIHGIPGFEVDKWWREKEEKDFVRRGRVWVKEGVEVKEEGKRDGSGQMM